MRLNITTSRGEKVALTLYRAGDATIAVSQAGDHRSAFLSPEDVDKLRTFLGSEPECAPFVADPQRHVLDGFIMSFETAPMVPTVRGHAEQG